jgi:hypothetical protein
VDKNRHSLGLDLTYFRWKYETDNSNDVALYQQREKRTYLYADYKFRIVSIKDWDIYFNAYEKLGYYKMWYSPYDVSFLIGDTSFIRNHTNGTFIETGAGFGFKKQFTDSKFGIDLSMNVALRKSKDNITEFPSSETVLTSNNNRYTETIFYMRLNLYYRFRK